MAASLTSPHALESGLRHRLARAEYGTDYVVVEGPTVCWCGPSVECDLCGTPVADGCGHGAQHAVVVHRERDQERA